MMDPMLLPVDALPQRLALPAPAHPGVAVPVRVRPPGSKSLTNRALFLAALGTGRSELHGALIDADDAQRMIEAVRVLGARVEITGDTVRVDGVGGRWKAGTGATIDLNNAGTATRFLAAGVLASDGPITVTGNERMQQRPIGELIDLLETLGVRAEYLRTPGCPPVRLTPPADLTTARVIEIPTTRSSQFISALLLVGSVLPGGITVRLIGEITSASYIRMTIEQMESLGVTVRASADLRVIRIEPGLPRFVTTIEPDASGACFWWAAGALRSDLRVFVEGIPQRSAQGDARFPSVLAAMGCTIRHDGDAIAVIGTPRLAPVHADLRDMPDAAPALAVVCAYAEGRSVIRGVRTLRVKETDRIAAIARELGRIGAAVHENYEGDPDAMAIDPTPAPGERETVFETYDDHRMAMSLALLALRRPGVVIDDPRCVGKTYPTYWAELARVMRA